jgi:uncharacterized protein DUF3631
MSKTTPAQRFAQIFKLFTNGATPGERASAEHKMDAWLARHGKTRNDIAAILVQAAADDAASEPPPPPSDPRDVDPSRPVGGAGIDGTNVTVLDLVRAFAQDYLAMGEHEFVAYALWPIHSHLYDRFMVTPRLVLTSPVRGCGKSVALDVLSRLVARPDKTDNITAAAIYDVIDREHCTLLIDEADNLELSAKGALRAVLNSGYRKGGTIRRGTGKQRRKYRTFAPIALASIGALTLPLMSRSIVIHMVRHDGSRPLRRFDLEDTRDLDLAYQHIRTWARDVVLNPDPSMPAELRGRVADNWRPLVSIADACGEAWGRLARAAAVVFAKAYRDEDIVVILLGDIREIFNARGVDRLHSQALVEALNAMEDAGWSEWRGLHGDQQPRKLTQGALAALLRLLHPPIRPRSVWSSPRRPSDSSLKGYYRSDFERAWRAYCDGAGTAAQPTRIIRLGGP